MRTHTERTTRLCELQNARDEATRRRMYAASRGDFLAAAIARDEAARAKDEIDRLLATAAPLVGRRDGQ